MMKISYHITTRRHNPEHIDLNEQVKVRLLTDGTGAFRGISRYSPGHNEQQHGNLNT
jgi:hypothetical protein